MNDLRYEIGYTENSLVLKTYSGKECSGIIEAPNTEELFKCLTFSNDEGGLGLTLRSPINQDQVKSFEGSVTKLKGKEVSHLDSYSLDLFIEEMLSFQLAFEDKFIRINECHNYRTRFTYN